jgi:hypothetical protein
MPDHIPLGHGSEVDALEQLDGKSAPVVQTEKVDDEKDEDNDPLPPKSPPKPGPKK